MVVTIKQRRIRRGGVSPPALETQRFTAKFVNLWLLYLSGGETPPLRTASLIQISPTAKFLFIGELPYAEAGVGAVAPPLLRVLPAKSRPNIITDFADIPQILRIIDILNIGHIMITSLHTVAFPFYIVELLFVFGNGNGCDHA